MSVSVCNNTSAAQLSVSSNKKQCRMVTKKVHGKKKRVQVCKTVARKPASSATATPLPTATPGPTPSPTSSGGFPVTSASLKNKASINVEPSMRPWRYAGPNPDGWWCQVPNCYQSATPLAMIDTEMQAVAQLGVGSLRVEFPWPLIEPTNGTYDWSRADYIVQEANKYGVQLWPILVFTPSWAGPDDTLSPTSTQTWSSFVSQVVSRYKNCIHYWELWNEPDQPHYWTDGDQNYVQHILVPGSQAVKGADPSAKVLLGAPSNATSTLLPDVYTYGGANAFDIAGFHEYNNVTNTGSVQSDVNGVQSILTTHGQASKPIWIGEYGYNESSNTTSDGNHISTMQVMLQQVTGYQVASWYNLRDDYSMTCCPPAIAVSAYWGLIQHDDTTKKQGFSSMQTIVSSLH